MEILTLTSKVEIKAAAKSADGAPDNTRRFEQLAYTGGIMDCGFGYPLIIDLAGLKIKSQAAPILCEHDRSRIAGFSDEIEKTDKKVTLRGKLCMSSPDGKNVANLADDGFPWQASVGVGIEKFKFLEAKETDVVNGVKCQGPMYVIKASFLKESSFVCLGADGNTKSVVLSAPLGKGKMGNENENESSFADLTVGEIKAKAPTLYDRIREEVLSDERKRQDSIHSDIKASGLPEAVRGLLTLRCSNMGADEARKEIERTANIEALFVDLKIQKFSDAEIDALRKDVAGLPLFSAKSLIAQYVAARRNPTLPIVQGQDPALTENPVNEKLKSVVAAARADFKEIKGKPGFDALKEKDLIASALSDAKITATDAELKAVAADLYS